MIQPNPSDITPPPAPPRDRWAARFREMVTAAIASGVVLITLFLIAVAAGRTGSDEQFARVKDLLLFVNPVVGIVIGYYFNRVSTETRAENAEATAEHAAAAASEAGRARDAAANMADEARGSLAEIVGAADRVAATRPQQRTLGGEPGDAGAVYVANAQLEAALTRARRMLARGAGAEPVDRSQ